MITYIVVEFIIIILVIVYFRKYHLSINERIKDIEKKMVNLSIISSYFPEFIEKGENLTKNISDELMLKQSALKKLIREAEKSSEKLGFLEDKINEQKLDQSTIYKILILVNQGFKASDIAPKLNIPIGEIDLVIKLRKYLNSPIKERL
jgi:hypothetical protein